MEEDRSAERQSILNLSMLKLQPCGKGETSLRRSVLIFNTLRHIETELQKDSAVTGETVTKVPKDFGLEPIPVDDVLKIVKEEEKKTPVEKKQECTSSSSEILQNTQYILDSLLSTDKVAVNNFTPWFPSCSPIPNSWNQQEMFCSKLDEPFTNWLLNDDLDHIMEILVSDGGM